MKKIITWIYVLAVVVLVIDWAVMGLKIFTNDYNITVEAYIGCACFVLMMICSVYRLFSNKCPHCGSLRLTGGAYCSHCGKKIEE